MKKLAKKLASTVLRLAFNQVQKSCRTAKAQWTAELKQEVWWLYVLGTLVCVLILFPYSFAQGFMLGLSFSWAAFVAIFFGYIFRNPLMLFVVFAGVVLAQAVSGLFFEAWSIAFQGDLVPSLILVAVGIFLTIQANRIKTGEVFIDQKPLRKRRTARRTR